MENVWILAALWAGLALVATLLAIWFRMSTALTEIVAGIVAPLAVGAFDVQGYPGAKEANRPRRLRWILPSQAPLKLGEHRIA